MSAARRSNAAGRPARRRRWPQARSKTWWCGNSQELAPAVAPEAFLTLRQALPPSEQARVLERLVEQVTYDAAQANGGPTQTMALLPGSPAIDAGDNNYSPEPYDQRGDGFSRIVNGTIDIGAFEVQGGGNSLAPPPTSGALTMQLGGIPLAAGSIAAIHPSGHSPANGRALQQPVSANVQREISASSSLDLQQGGTRRYDIDSLFAALHNGGLDQHMSDAGHLFSLVAAVATARGRWVMGRDGRRYMHLFVRN
jgi:hypothetical protein